MKYIFNNKMKNVSFRKIIKKSKSKKDNNLVVAIVWGVIFLKIIKMRKRPEKIKNDFN